MIREELEIHDPEILTAVKYHTTGHAGMEKLTKIIYLADMIEPRRDFPGVEELREAARKDLDLAVHLAAAHTLDYILKHHKPMHPDSVGVYNDYLIHKEEN